MLRQAKTVWKCSKSTSKFCTSKRHSISTGATRRKTKIWNSMHFLTLPSCSENRDSTACKLPMKFKIWTSFVIGWIKGGVNFIFPFIGSNFMGSLHAVLTENRRFPYKDIQLGNLAKFWRTSFWLVAGWYGTTAFRSVESCDKLLRRREPNTWKF